MLLAKEQNTADNLYPITVRSFMAELFGVKVAPHRSEKLTLNLLHSSTELLETRIYVVAPSAKTRIIFNWKYIGLVLLFYADFNAILRLYGSY